MNRQNIGYKFIVLGFSCLLLSVILGLVASLQYLFPQLLADHLSFQHTRPLHVFLAINWIFSCVTGIIYYYLPEVSGKKLYAPVLAQTHFILLCATILIVISGFLSGTFSGREYLEFPPWVSLIIVAYWILFCINFFRTAGFKLKGAPVYMWSWYTGLIFFLITMTEAHLWLLPFFNNNIIRDVTVQWKANGSMVGAWNMLIYGTAMYAMERITGKKEMAYQKTSFAFYFLGLTNLMFNWGHHTYIVPANPIIKEVAYIISMTELILLANIIMKWKRGLLKDENTGHLMARRFFMSADRWILLNLALAIAISVPYINQYTHGTQITVAHAMGATIGINTTLLLASVTFIFENRLSNYSRKAISIALKVTNMSLLLFWASLVGAGITKSIATVHGDQFYLVTQKLLPYLRIFSGAGLVLVAGLATISITYLNIIFKRPAEQSSRAPLIKAGS